VEQQPMRSVSKAVSTQEGKSAPVIGRPAASKSPPREPDQAVKEPSSPIRKSIDDNIPKKAGYASPVAPKTETKQAARPSKQDRKAFSLGSLMRPSITKDSSSRGGSTAEASVKSAPVPTGKPAPLVVPTWVKEPPTIAAPTEDPRSLGLEFLVQAAEQFPTGKINVDSVARSLEAAIYDAAKQETDWKGAYWPKVHALVAAICGKQEQGTLMNMIVMGRFETAEKVASLPFDKLAASFEGRPVDL
jgi:hypothetical protein